jgi:hypothetical protein
VRTERRQFVQAREEETRRVIHGSVTVDRGTGAITFRIPHKLEGLNQRILGAHWIKKHQAREAWETAIKICIGDYLGRDSITEFHPDYIRALGFPALDTSRKCITGRRVIAVTRCSPKARNFLKDTDNRFMALKPLVDAIKNLRLIRGDSANWTTLMPIQQRVSEDGRWWTEFVIALPAGEPVPFPAAL